MEATNAGPGNLEVIVNNGKVPSSPQALGPSLYAISFVPKDAETHFIEIRFNGEQILGSPFICNVIDASKMLIEKETLERIPVNVEAAFSINTRGSSFVEQFVSILGPGNRIITPLVTGDPDSGYRVAFTPTEVGDHVVDVKVAGDSVPPSPFLVKVYDARKVSISEIKAGSLGKPVYFTIDASQAGAGNLEIIVSVNGKNVPNYVQSEGNAKFKVNFKPTEANVHTVSVKFNGEAVPGSPYVVRVDDLTQTLAAGVPLRMAAIGKTIEFNIENKNNVTDCRSIVSCPSGKKIKPSISHAGSFFTLAFTPVEVGPHQVSILMNGSPMPPVGCNVYDVSKVRVTGLSGGITGKPVTFQVDASTAGEGTLELVVTTKKTSVRAEVLMRSRGLYDVTFVPQEKVPHFLNIQFNEEDVVGSPFRIEVKGSDGTTADNDTLVKKRQETATRELKMATGVVGSANVSSFEWPFPDKDTRNVEVKVTGMLSSHASI